MFSTFQITSVPLNFGFPYLKSDDDYFLRQIMASGTNEALRSAGSVLSGNETEKYYKHSVTCFVARY